MKKIPQPKLVLGFANLDERHKIDPFIYLIIYDYFVFFDRA